MYTFPPHDGDSSVETDKESIVVARNKRHFMQLLTTSFAYGLPLAFFLYYHWFHSEPILSSPTHDLRAFVSLEKRKNELIGIEDLYTDEFKGYAQAYCMSANSANEVRDALRVQLADVPLEARERVIERAIIDGVSQKSALQDTTAKLATEGHAHSFMAFWSTSYSPKKTVGTYDTCAVIAGVEIDVAETVAEWVVETRPVHVGYKPCHCGLFTCMQCPVFQDETTRTPVFKRRVLSLKQQKELHHWLVSHAVETAESLVGTLDGGKAGSLLSLSGWTDHSSAAYNQRERESIETDNSAATAIQQPKKLSTRISSFP